MKSDLEPTRPGPPRSLPRLALAATAVVVSAVALLLAVPGCKKEVAVAPEQQQVRLGYFANFTHAQAVLGVASGDFERAVAPAKFSTKVFNAGPSLIEALFAGEVDIGYVGPGPALNGLAKSRGDVRVVSGAAANGVLIVARKDSGINTLTDLAGKRVATPQHGNTQDISARHYLKTELKQTDLKVVAPIANADQLAAMTRGDVDASWAPEPWGSYLVSQAGATVVGTEQSLWPEGSFATVVVITTPAFLQKHPDVVEKVLGVHLAWTDKLKADPDAQLPQLEAALNGLTKKSLPAGVLKSSLANTTFTEDPLEHTFVKFNQWSYDLGFAKQPSDLAGFIDTTIVKKLRASGGAGPAGVTSKPATQPAGAAVTPATPATQPAR